MLMRTENQETRLLSFEIAKIHTINFEIAFYEICYKEISKQFPDIVKGLIKSVLN